MSRPALLLPLFALACDPATPAACDAAAEVPGVLEIGTGEEAYAPVSDGDELHLAYGPQGGQHVWGSLRAEGIVGPLVSLDDSKDPVVTYEVYDAEGTLLGGYQDYPRRFEPEGEAFVVVGDTLVLEYWEEGFEGYEGLEVTIAAHLVDACGRELSAERVVTLRE